MATEKRDIAAARLRAQLSVIDSLLEPLEKRLESQPTAPEEDDSVEKVESAIAALSTTLDEANAEYERLQSDRRDADETAQRARSQIRRHRRTTVTLRSSG